MKSVNIKKAILPNLPYAFIALYATKLGQAARLSPGADFSAKALHIMEGFAAAFQSALPSFHPIDLCVGVAAALLIRLAVYVKGKNARKFRKNIEYGSARWGNAEDIKPYRFMNYDYLQSKGVTPERGGYDAIYTGGFMDYGNARTNLDMIYQRFNVDHPADFKGHSLSVSDIVALKQNGVVSCHYVDSIGFRELPIFLKPENYLKNAEMLLEDDYGMIDGIINNGPKQPTVADLEAQVKAGFPISLTELAAASHREQKKPSVLEKLRERTPEQSKNKTAPKRSAEREL